ncbi:venom allergen 5-like isoform X1 [Daphnia pulicaria]|uniref:venom allergen 5-like isoform X1 n=1 Tax=Daphnia pulicaria TaxID=35523 RepID=UPI001EEBA9B5|nr:venom allergen 5-like isoform X1 [Daphnia pulicaria]
MKTFAATVLVAAACFLVFSDAQSSVEPAVTRPAANLTAATNFCKIPSCGPYQPQHVYCLYPSPTWGKACKPAYPTKSIVTDADIKTILKVHNDYRRKVAQGLETQGSPGPQPPASNMRELKWDQELAAMAVTLTRQCIGDHDGCRNVPRFRVGQNLFIFKSQSDTAGNSDWNGAITAWYNEVQYMNTTYVQSLPSSPPNVIGHYTQAVWADTSLVGCAVAYFQTTTSISFPYNRMYVCNYGPTGNYRGSAVYKQGTSGSACPAGTVNSNGLCNLDTSNRCGDLGSICF